jgi:hypothetical protein
MEKKWIENQGPRSPQIQHHDESTFLPWPAGVDIIYALTGVKDTSLGCPQRADIGQAPQTKCLEPEHSAKRQRISSKTDKSPLTEENDHETWDSGHFEARCQSFPSIVGSASSPQHCTGELLDMEATQVIGDSGFSGYQTRTEVAHNSIPCSHARPQNRKPAEKSNDVSRPLLLKSLQYGSESWKNYGMGCFENESRESRVGSGFHGRELTPSHARGSGNITIGVQFNPNKICRVLRLTNYSCRDIGQRFSNISLVTQMLLRMRAG